MRFTNCPWLWPRSTSTSPRVDAPLLYSAQTLARSTLTGHTWPVQPRSERSPSTAERKSPLYCSIMDSRRLPPVCPAGFESIDGRRDSSTRRASASLRASASAHFMMSPGGSTPSSSRSCPELPPLSNIVTMAFRRSQGLTFSPPSRLGRPVPPPKQPMFSSCNRIRWHSNQFENYYNALMTATDTLATQLRDVFGDRLRMVAAFGHGSHTVAVVDNVTAADLHKCAAYSDGWKKIGLAPPLVMPLGELSRA